MSLHDELLFQACCIHCHNLARKYCKNTRTILCAANISKNNLQHNKKCPQEKTEMFQSSLIMTMGLGAINSAVSKGKCVLIMQMSKFKRGTVEKIIIKYKSCGRNRTFAFAILVWKFPLPYLKIFPDQVSDEIQPPPPLPYY